MRVHIVRTDVSHGSVWLAGTEADLADDLAKALISEGIAEAAAAGRKKRNEVDAGDSSGK